MGISGASLVHLMYTARGAEETGPLIREPCQLRQERHVYSRAPATGVKLRRSGIGFGPLTKEPCRS
jgi:hypothetical protein